MLSAFAAALRRAVARESVARAEALRSAAANADSNEVTQLLKQASAASNRLTPLANAARLPSCDFQ